MRLTAAVVDAVAEHGYTGTTVAHIVRRARVSRETFYEHFPSKDACYLAAVGVAFDELRHVIGEALGSSPDPLGSLDAFLRAYLEWMAARPQVARCLLLELRDAGRPTLAREDEAMRTLVDRLMARIDPRDRFACEMFVAALRQMVGLRVDGGGAASLPELREPLLRVAQRYAAGPLVSA